MMNLARGQGYSHVDTPCQKNPDLFFVEDSLGQDLAIEICNKECPVKERCLRQAEEAEEQFGVWGGKVFVPVVKLSPLQEKRKVELDVPMPCGKNLHTLPAGRANNTCTECANERKRNKYSTPEGKAKVKQSNERRKNSIGSKCRAGKHILTSENTTRRAHDGALMCLECLQSPSRKKFKTDTGSRETGRGNSGVWKS